MDHASTSIVSPRNCWWSNPIEVMAVARGRPIMLVASSLPPSKMGIYMGLFNVFVVIPQLLVATVMGSILKAYFPTEPIWTMAFAAAVMLCAALAMLRVEEVSD